jgi:hypothetical protein
MNLHYQGVILYGDCSFIFKLLISSVPWWWGSLVCRDIAASAPWCTKWMVFWLDDD